eukprot:3907972-Pleurochrysis_carterae.AAC.1
MKSPHCKVGGAHGVVHPMLTLARLPSARREPPHPPDLAAPHQPDDAPASLRPLRPAAASAARTARLLATLWLCYWGQAASNRNRRRWRIRAADVRGLRVLPRVRPERAAKVCCGRCVRPKRAAKLCGQSVLRLSVRPKVREWSARPRRAAQVCRRACGH